jgi:hypothetical protein
LKVDPDSTITSLEVTGIRLLLLFIACRRSSGSRDFRAAERKVVQLQASAAVDIQIME